MEPIEQLPERMILGAVVSLVEYSKAELVPADGPIFYGVHEKICGQNIAIEIALQLHICTIIVYICVYKA